MKISKRVKLYSLIFSSMVLGGIAITASSCAADDASTQNNSSSQTPKNQEPNKESPADDYEGGASEAKEPNKKDDPSLQEEQPQVLPDASQLFAKSYEVNQAQKLQTASEAVEQINIDNLNQYIDLPVINIDNLTVSIKLMQPNDKLGIIDVTLNQNYLGSLLDKTISFQITGFQTQVINYLELQPATGNISNLFDKSYNVIEDKSNQLASTALKDLDINNLDDYIVLPTIPSNFKIEIDSINANDVLGTINVILNQFYLQKPMPNKITLQITGFKLRDLSSLFANSYQVLVQHADQLASVAAQDLTFDKLKELVYLPEITSEFQLNVKSVTSDDLAGTINVVLDQVYQETIMSNEISFEINGFSLRSSASLFAANYDLLPEKSASLPSIIVSELTSYDALSNYVNLPEVPNSFSLTLGSVKANDADNSIDVTLNQTYLSNDINLPTITFKITNINNAVNNSWVPINDDLIRQGVSDLSDKKEFNQFIVSHWNQSLANDALNAIRWVYSDAVGQNVLTNNFRKYIKDGWNAGTYWNWTMGYLMGYNDSGAAKGFMPTYTSNVSLQSNGNLRLNLGWYQKQFVQHTVGGNYTADVSGSIYFDVSISTKPSINKTSGTAELLNTRLEAVINNEAKGYRPSVHDGANVTINILDALYYYYNQTSSHGIAIKSSMFSGATNADPSEWGTNLYSLFGPLFKYKDTSKDKFTYRK